MPSDCITLVTTSANRYPADSGRFRLRNSSNAAQGDDTSVGTAGDPPPPPPERPETLSDRGSNDIMGAIDVRNSSDFTKSGNP
jgi:hypothetical protein